jgi:predicted AlkP superfamily phosphohydrolase/phosphomutase
VRPLRSLLAGLVVVALAALGYSKWHERQLLTAAPGSKAKQRTVVIGFDGMDPALLERWMVAGALPHFAALKAQGHYQKLASTEPAQSPVAWSSFATGLDPGAHGIFDFLHRDAQHYAPEFSIARSEPVETVDFLGMTLPLGDAKLDSGRSGTSFWSTAEATGQRASVMRVPVTFPPEPVQQMISGMGVPDLLGTQGSYTLIANHLVPAAESGGHVVLQAAGEDGNITASVPGPAHPLYPRDSLALPIRIIRTPEPSQVVVELDGVRAQLSTGDWSEWIPMRYRFLGVGRIPGMVRLRLISGFPKLRLYVSPAQVDPLDPAFQVSAPEHAATALAMRIGRFHTLGMPEETWAFNQGHMDEQGWLDMVATTLGEGEAMLYDSLDRGDSELVIKVFVQPDRVSHMFWRGLDKEHPLHAQSSLLARDAIAWIYRESDRVLGEIQSRLGPDDRLIVLSDHGFTSFRRAVHINRWLIEHGYLTLKPEHKLAGNLFDGVDWSRSRAYALGLNSLFVNRRGRESQGVVEASDMAALKTELASALLGWRDQDGSPVFAAVHDADDIYPGAADGHRPDLVLGYASGYRASWQTTLGAAPTSLIDDNLQNWSGDHCVDSALVPGILMSNFQPALSIDGIADVSRLIVDDARPTQDSP